MGIPNTSDPSRGSRGRRETRTILRSVRRYNPRTQFWFTETRGVVNFGSAFRCNEGNAAKSVARMFQLARTYRRYVKRLYVYNWTGADCDGFDTGLTRADGSLRPSYHALKRQLRNFLR